MKSYTADNTCQIREHNRRHVSSSLAVHELGRPARLGRDTVRPWKAFRWSYTPTGRAAVTSGAAPVSTPRTRRRSASFGPATSSRPVAAPGRGGRASPRVYRAREAAEALGVDDQPACRRGAAGACTPWSRRARCGGPMTSRNWPTGVGQRRRGPEPDEITYYWSRDDFFVRKVGPRGTEIWLSSEVCGSDSRSSPGRSRR